MKRQRPKWESDLPRDIAVIEEEQEIALRSLNAADFAKEATRHEDGSRTIDMSPRMVLMMRLQKQLFRAVFKREPNEVDPVFWDREREHLGVFPIRLPSEDVKFKWAVASGMRKPQAYAFAKTGMLIVGGNEHLYTEEQLEEWDDAIDEYEVLDLERIQPALQVKTPLREWDEKLLLEAKALWDESFGAGGDEQTLFDHIGMTLVAAGVLPAELPVQQNDDGTFDKTPEIEQAEQVIYDLKSRGLWAEAGYPTLKASHTFTAALASTTVSKENAEDIEVPWLTFMVHLPSDMFAHPETGEMIDRLLVSQQTYPKKFATMNAYSREKDKQLGMRTPVNGTLADLLFVDEEKLEDLMVSESARLWRVLCRVCVGLLYTLQHTNNWKSKYPIFDSKRTFEKGPPKHRVVIVGRPLNYDARPGVAAYLRGDRPGHGPPSVQSLVMGHYKRQVVGIGRRGRKVIWIEPYWRGPKDAPILMRPHKLGDGP
jgi:hypothetical protein